jgi:hypothetical protein
MNIGLPSNNFWLVVSTPPKNINQLGLLFPIYAKLKNVPNHQPGIYNEDSMGYHHLHSSVTVCEHVQITTSKSQANHHVYHRTKWAMFYSYAK